VTPRRWIANNLKALDILGNTSVGCSEDVETFSRRAGRARHAGKRWGCVVCALLNPLARVICRLLGLRVPDDHCEESRLAGEVY
jgi:hypothetical protein